MPIELEDSVDGCAVRLDGEIGLSCVADLQRVLVQARESGKPTAVDLSGVTDLDMAAVQVLYAATRENRTTSEFVTGPENLPDHVEAAIRVAGFDPHNWKPLEEGL